MLTRDGITLRKAHIVYTQRVFRRVFRSLLRRAANDTRHKRKRNQNRAIPTTYYVVKTGRFQEITRPAKNGRLQFHTHMTLLRAYNGRASTIIVVSVRPIACLCLIWRPKLPDCVRACYFSSSLGDWHTAVCISQNVASTFCCRSVWRPARRSPYWYL